MANSEQTHLTRALSTGICRAALLTAAFVVCSGFGWAGPECCGRTGYTRQVVPLDSGDAYEPSLLVPNEANTSPPAERADTPGEAPMTALMSLDLKLRDYGWRAKSLFGRLLTFDSERTLLPESIALVSEVVFEGLIDPVRAFSNELISVLTGKEREPATAFSQHGQPGIGTAPTRHLPPPRIVDGHIHSLATSMGSAFDPTMGLDDIERRNDYGLQVGLRIEKPLSGEDTQGLNVLVVPSLPGS